MQYLQPGPNVHDGCKEIWIPVKPRTGSNRSRPKLSEGSWDSQTHVPRTIRKLKEAQGTVHQARKRVKFMRW